MRPVALLAAGVLFFAFQSVASAQTISIDHVVRSGSPRVSELPITGLAVSAPIGLRDCSCETWTIAGSISGTVAGPNPRLEFWVGTTPDACATAENRLGSGTSTPSCWPIPPDVVPGQGAGPVFSVTIPSVLLVNPMDRQCVPLSGRPATGSMFLTVLAFGPATATPFAAQEIDYILDPPPPPANAAALPQDASAQITWSIVDSPVSLAGYYVLCFPGAPATFDGGLVSSCSTPFDRADAGDAGSLGDVASDGEIPDAENDGDGVSGLCRLASVPSSFDLHDDTQFVRYRCSPLLSRTTTSFAVSGLTNGAAYRFSVVSQDTAGNRSALNATTDCVLPEPAVSSDGGLDGSLGGPARGCACSATQTSVPARGVVVMLSMFSGLAALGLRRRRYQAGRDRS
jgi:hypothetical protein